jgi:hypothetical protein
MTVLTEENLDEIGARVEHLPCKSLTQLDQKAQVSTTAVHKLNITSTAI